LNQLSSPSLNPHPLGRKFSLKEMETPRHLASLLNKRTTLRKEILSERDGNIMIAATERMPGRFA